MNWRFPEGRGGCWAKWVKASSYGMSKPWQEEYKDSSQRYCNSDVIGQTVAILVVNKA